MVVVTGSAAAAADCFNPCLQDNKTVAAMDVLAPAIGEAGESGLGMEA